MFLKRQIVEFLLRGSPDAAKKASVDATLQELRRVRDGVEEQAARRGELENAFDMTSGSSTKPLMLWCCKISAVL